MKLVEAKIDLTLLHKRLEELGDNREKLMEALHIAQELFSYLPEPVIEAIAKHFHLPPAHVYGIASFYSDSFKLEKPAEYVVKVCIGSQCYLNGGREILNEMKEKYGLDLWEVTPDKRIGLYPVKCIKCCSKPPVVIVNGRVFTSTSFEQVQNIIEK